MEPRALAISRTRGEKGEATVIDLVEYRKHIEDEIAKLKQGIDVLESGQVSLRSKDGDGPWVDTTADAIARDKRVLGTYEMILADIDKRLS